jgi:hypothetical protein
MNTSWFSAGGGFFAALSRKERDCAYHLQHSIAGIPDQMELAWHEQDCITSADGTFTLLFCFEHAFSFKALHLVFLLVVVERTVTVGSEFHQPQSISRATIIGSKKEAGLHTRKTGFVHRYGWDLRYVFEDHGIRCIFLCRHIFLP